MRKPTICICENKDADQLRGNREADQRLCFHYMDSTIPLLLKSEIASFYPASVTVQAGLCRTCSDTTLLVFPRGGSNAESISGNFPISFLSNILVISCSVPAFVIDKRAFSVDTVGDNQTADLLCDYL